MSAAPAQHRWGLALFAVAALAAVAAMGPRNGEDANHPPAKATPLPATAAELPAAVAALEREVPGVIPGAEKTVRLGAAGTARAPWAVVYLHGFSATRQETSPLSETVADALGAHFFATRLAGHGRGGTAMADASVAKWKADALQALAIGRLLGERVLVISVSTGGPLAVWLAQQAEAAQGTAWVLISPNFGPRDPNAEIVNWPWGRTLTKALVGPTRGFTPASDEQARYWTTEYPTEALFPMMATVELARMQPLERWKAPVLMMISPDDRVIDTGAARAAFDRIGSPAKRLVEVTDSSDPSQHVLTGRILSPGNLPAMADTIVRWVQAQDVAAVAR